MFLIDDITKLIFQKCKQPLAVRYCLGIPYDNGNTTRKKRLKLLFS